MSIVNKEITYTYANKVFHATVLDKINQAEIVMKDGKFGGGTSTRYLVEVKDTKETRTIIPNQIKAMGFVDEIPKSSYGNSKPQKNDSEKKRGKKEDKKDDDLPF